MSVNLNPDACLSTAASLDMMQNAADDTNNQIQQYLVLSNMISALFDPQQGIVTNAAAAQSRTAASTSVASTPDVTAISTDPVPPTDEASARAQAAGLLAFYHMLIDNGGISSSLLQWIQSRLTTIINSGMLDKDQTDGTTPFTTMVNDAINAFGTQSKFDTFWNNTDPTQGDTPLTTILNYLENSQNQPSLLHPDEDTMFSLIMLFKDLSQSSAKDYVQEAQDVFSFWQPGDISSAGMQYGSFVALYMTEQSSVFAQNWVSIKTALDANTQESDLGGFTAQFDAIAGTWNINNFSFPKTYGSADQVKQWTDTIWSQDWSQPE